MSLWAAITDTSGSWSLTTRARYDRRTKQLIPRLRRGEVAVIDHVDLDGLAAQGLVEAGVAAVVNLSPYVTGQYPNTGPGVLHTAGIRMFRCTDNTLAEVVSTSPRVTLSENSLVLRDRTDVSFALQPYDMEQMTQEIEAARDNLHVALTQFAENTLDYIKKETGPILDPMALPQLRTRFKNRHAVVVVRGERFDRDLAAIAAYIRERKPVIVAVDGAADALLAQGFRPDMVVGDMDSVSDRALRCGAELVAHEYVGSKRHSPALERLQQEKLPHVVWKMPGTSEDLALLIAYERGADLIVAVGSHFGLIDFLQKGRAGMSSTFLTRLKVGDRLVDAKGVSRLYPSRPLKREFAWLVAAAVTPVVVAFLLTPTGRNLLRLLEMWFRQRFNL